MISERGVFARAALVAALAMSLMLGLTATMRPMTQITTYLSTHAP